MQESLAPSIVVEESAAADIEPSSHKNLNIISAEAQQASDESYDAEPSWQEDFNKQQQNETNIDATGAFKLFQSDSSCNEISTEIVNNLTDRLPAIRDLIWVLIRDGELSLAYHLAKGLEESDADLHPMLPSWIIRAVIIGRNVGYYHGESARLIKKDFPLFSEDCFSKSDKTWNQALRLMMIAATLRPALTAPDSGASAIITSIHLKGLETLYKYCEKIADFCNRVQRPLDFNMLMRIKGQTERRQELERLCTDAELWLKNASNFIMKFGRAKKLWIHWIKEGGIINALLMPVIQNDSARTAEVETEVKRLSDESSIRREIDATDQKLNRAARDSIVAVAYKAIADHTAEAVGFAKRWLDIYNAGSDLSRGFELNNTKDLFNYLNSIQEGVFAELASFEQQNGSLCIRAGINVCRRSLEDLRPLFDAHSSIAPKEELPVASLLNGSLLRVKNLQFDDSWAPMQSAASLLDPIISMLADDDNGWLDAFESYSSERDHVTTGRIIELLESSMPGHEDIESMRRLRESRISDCKEALMRDANETRKKIENGVSLGYVGTADRTEFITQIEASEKNCDSIRDFRREHQRLAEIKAEIQQREEIKLDHIKQRMRDEKIDSDHPAFETIQNAIDKKDLQSADEYISLAADGRQLPARDETAEIFSEFFPQRYRDIYQHLVDSRLAQEPGKLIRELREYGSQGQPRNFSIGPIAMSRAGGNQAIEAAQMLEAWFNMKKSRKSSDDDIRSLFNGIGFQVIEIKWGGASKGWFEIRTEPINDRNICPIPAFGSLAKGRYRILCVWDRPTEDELIQQIGETNLGLPPAIVLFFGWMTEQRRRDLAHICRDRRRTFIVIDEIVLLYSCGERGSRLPLIFRTTLPFTYSEPYTTTAGEVPAEMFYGREQELIDAVSLQGSSFIYGGRQLGKTVLLRTAEKRLHSPDDGKIAKWIDLKGEGIGYDRSIDDIWPLLTRELKKENVLSDKTPEHIGKEKLMENIENWIKGHQDRRILLLLDEADEFLRSDAQDNFPRLNALKKAMDNTGRNFKAVFAGLHNVLRTTSNPNHTLAHYATGSGGAICIGPLLDNGEFRYARALIEIPFSTLGYRFESPDLATRILSQTNYYPSLIQLYCNCLLRHVNNRNNASFDSKFTPPYTITSRHIDEAYRNQGLQQRIKDRFLWTLQLDQRYEVIAYIIALGATQEREKIVDGFSEDWIREQVLSWWESGFRDSLSKEALSTLLDEMAGLGVLRRTGKGNYTLRSPNLIALMGTKEELENVLYKDREPTQAYDPEKFRSALSNQTKAGPKRNPLTALQEAKLRSRENGISIVYGCRASGIDYLKEFLINSFGAEYFKQMECVSSAAEFSMRMDDQKIQNDSTTLLLISSDCPWDEDWIKEVGKKIEKLKSKNRFLRFLFVADPDASWRLLEEQDGDNQWLARYKISELLLGPWHDVALKQWLDDCALTNDLDKRKEIARVTGNWPLLLEEFYKKTGSGHHPWERHLSELERSLTDKQTADQLLSSFGLNRIEIKETLQTLLELESAPKEEIIGLAEKTSPPLVAKSIDVAEKLNLIRLHAGDVYTVDPLVAKLLKTAKELR